MIKKLIAFGLGAIFFAGVAMAAPNNTFQRNLLPEVNQTYDLGSTTPNLQWKGIYTKDLFVSGTCTGCGGSSGTVSTSTNETQGFLPYWTTTSGTPAKLGQVATTTLTATTPLSLSNVISVIGATPSVLTCAVASGSLAGCLSSTDWTTFNNKQASGFQIATTSTVAISGLAYFTDTTPTVLGSVATGTVSVGSTALTVTAGRSVIGGALSIDCATSSGSQNGCLSSTDWTTFNSKESALTFTYPLTRSVNAISLAFGTTTANDWSQLQRFANGVQASSTSLFATTTFYGTGDDIIHIEGTNTQHAVHLKRIDTGGIHYSATNPTTGQTNTDGSDFGIDSSGNTIIRQREALDIQFLTNGSEKFTVESNGNVGVASSTPAQLFSVGNALTNGGLYFSTTGLAVGSSTPAFPFAVTPVLSNLASTFYINSSGAVVAYDSTNAWAGRLSPTRSFVLSTATTTAWTASTTNSAYSPYLVMPFAGTLRQVRCTTDTSFLGVNTQIAGSNATPSYFVASTSVGKVPFTAGNTFTAGQKVSADFGTTTTATTKSVACTFDVTETP